MYPFSRFYIQNMILTLSVALTLLIMQVSTCDQNPICPIPITLNNDDRLKQEMMSLLDMERKPEKTSNKKIKYSTKFMLDLYKIVSQDNDDSNRIKRESFSFQHNLSEDEIVMAELSDVIVSMNCVNKKSDGVGQRQKLAFSMRNVPRSARLIGAELKLYQDKKMAQKTSHSLYTLSVYKPYQLTPGIVKMKKVGEKITSVDFTGWLSVDIAYLFETWLQYRQKIQELYISAQPLVSYQEKEVHPASIGIIFQHKQLENEPFIVAFLHANNVVNTRFPRNIMLDSKNTNLLEVLANSDRCSMYTLKIAFKDLGWSDWVIAPEGYTTGYCLGSCRFPLKYPTKTTKHALIQSLMHIKNPKFPNPSCTPVGTSQLSVLFKEKENTILKNYKDMIVRSCGCH